MEEVVIVDAIRTPVGNLGGGLAKIRPDDLAAHVLKSLLTRNDLDPRRVEEVILGCANQAGEDNRNVARMATLLAGFPQEIPAITVNRLCASGLAAINLAARAIRCGDGDVYIAGGVESMSRAPYVFAKGENAYPTGNLTVFDTAIGWRFPNPKMAAMYGVDPMGVTAENLAVKYNISREDQDLYAYQSHQKAIKALDDGLFQDEIIPVFIPQKKGEAIPFITDEHPRRDTTLEKLATLQPVFAANGSVTAGNSSSLNDGAAALLLMSATTAAKSGYRPMARWVSSASAGVEPRIMGIGPVPASRKALSRAGLSLSDLGLVEINEAFAAQTLAVLRELEIDADRVNVNGGAIAYGHPLGCSGARITTTLLHEMKRRSNQQSAVQYGLATLCVGVGQGEATILEWIGT